MSDVLRLYAPEELGADGYPPAWHKRECTLCQGLGRVDAVWLGSDNKPVEIDCPACGGSGNLPIKAMIRAMAGHRCVRCKHPYRAGDERISAKGEWSPCDERCRHSSPLRITWPDGDELHDRESVDPGTYLPREILQAYEGGTVEAQWRILTVHHLDGNKANCRWFNLCALCQRCHLAIQGKVVMERAFIFEHSGWFKPYAAGWYALKYEGREITRAEADAKWWRERGEERPYRSDGRSGRALAPRLQHERKTRPAGPPRTSRGTILSLPEPT